jgi:hypothetical protein
VLWLLTSTQDLRDVLPPATISTTEHRLSFAWYQQTAGLTQIEGGELDCGNSGLRFDGGTVPEIRVSASAKVAAHPFHSQP